MVAEEASIKRSRPSRRQFIRSQGFWASGYGGLVFGTLFMALCVNAVVIIPGALQFEAAPIIALVGVPLVVLWWAVISALLLRGLDRGAQLQWWASLHGFRYTHQQKVVGAAPWQGTPFPRSGTFAVRHYLSGPGFESARFRALPEQSGYSSAGVFNAFTFAQFDLPTRVPHLFVTNRKSSVLSAAGLSISKGRKLGGSIEFDATFTLHSPADYERDALYIFTPDLLAMLLDVAPGGELELVDNRAFLYLAREPELWRPEVIESLIAFIDALTAKLERQTRRYKDERGGSPAPTGGNALGLGGVRLGTRTNARGRVLKCALLIPTIGLIAGFVAAQLGWISL